MTGTSQLQQPRLASDNLILGIVAAYAATFVAFGFLVQPPADVLRGLGAILTTRDALLTDYFGVGGIGGGCVSAGLLTLAGVFVYWRAGAKVTGASVAALFLVLGFGLFGKNLLNVWPIVAGVALYARFRGEPFRAHLNTAFFGGALAPIFSEILFSTDLTPMVSVPLALLTGLAVGFILPPAAAHLSRAHMGFSLYNMGFAAGIVGTIVVAMYKSVRLRARPCLHLDKRGEQTARHIPRPRVRVDGRRRLGLRPQRARTSANHSEDVGPVADGFYRACRVRGGARQYGLAGAIGVAYVLVTGGALNGPSIGAILTIVGFAAFGKHPRNIAPIMIGVFLGALARSASPADPGLTLAALFGTTLAPIAGRFGFGWGIVAGILHSAAALTVGPLHAGLNLYNNGFAAGIVASFLVPVIVALRAGFGYHDDLDAEAARKT
jgi:Protein of unknown function (DUF1576)